VTSIWKREWLTSRIAKTAVISPNSAKYSLSAPPVCPTTTRFWNTTLPFRPRLATKSAAMDMELENTPLFFQWLLFAMSWKIWTWFARLLISRLKIIVRMSKLIMLIKLFLVFFWLYLYLCFELYSIYVYY
jgi:hypothetical protein